MLPCGHMSTLFMWEVPLQPAVACMSRGLHSAPRAHHLPRALQQVMTPAGPSLVCKYWSSHSDCWSSIGSQLSLAVRSSRITDQLQANSLFRTQARMLVAKIFTARLCADMPLGPLSLLNTGCACGCWWAAPSVQPPPHERPLCPDP